jgi:cobaltochelatase CobN
VALAKARGDTLPAAAARAQPGKPPAGSRVDRPSDKAAAATPAVPKPPARVYELHQKAVAPQAAPMRVARLLACLAAGLALFAVGLARGRHVPTPVIQPVRSFT